MIFPIRRTLVTVPLALLLFGAAGCGGEGSNTNCSINSCTVTFNRGVDASASILGIKAELVDVKGNQVTLNVGGQRVTVPVNGEQQAEGFNIEVQSVTDENVVVKISQGGGGG
ncbi:MAG: hypothetical protein ACRDOO_20615 [Actinomadura sp.]